PVTFILVLLAGINTSSLYAQGCSSQNVTVTNFFFADANQNEIDPNAGYEIGEPINGFIYASFGGSSGNGYSLYFEYELFINDVSYGKVSRCLFNQQRIPSGTIERIGSFTW